jgi:hypothetical protein
MTCTHFWLIDPPNGPESRGTCTRCYGVRMFKNSLPAKWGYRSKGDDAEAVRQRGLRAGRAGAAAKRAAKLKTASN